MTDKQLPPDWAIARAFRECQVFAAPSKTREFILFVEHRARELSAQQPDAARGEPKCPACGEVVQFECIACSTNNYPQAEPEQPARDGVEAKLEIAHLVIQRLIADGYVSQEQVDATARSTREAEFSRSDWPGREFWAKFYAPISQPPQQADGAAKHWHDLYRKECRLRQDDAARYGQEIIELEDRIAQPADGEAVYQLRPNVLNGANWADVSEQDYQQALTRPDLIEARTLYLRPTRGVEVTEEDCHKAMDAAEYFNSNTNISLGAMRAALTSFTYTIMERDKREAALSGVR